ncbi:hypothetical protein Pfo_015048 [Paulownia fortunei]|nr:hypothetical protein Pfo_015048 [Paulownia fortunei]
MAFSFRAMSATSCNFTSCFPFSSPPALHSPLFFPNKSPVSTNKTQNHAAKFACKAKDSGDDSPKTNPDKKEIPELKFDRRDFLLIGFGSTAANLDMSSSFSPDFSNCVDSTKPDGTPINCCPASPVAAEITDFVPSAAAAAARVRVPAQLVDGSSMAKYRKAIELLKQLPTSDPRSFLQQANVHCAYCDGAYNQDGYSNLKFEIHQSWLFFPFHRWYLYFFERICAKVLQDETFALPFWNWDSPSGMEIPAMFNVTTSPLYDRLRNQDHLPPTVVDLNWSGLATGVSPETQIKYNLSLMYKQMVTNATTPRLFLGQPFRAGDNITTIYGAGSIEVAPHNTLHTWTGDPREPYTENMGVFYSAARDPIFYTHHANIDRLWTIWVSKLQGKVFSDPDWLEASFVFYNEDAKPVRVKIKDGLDLSRLGYAYEEVQTPWLHAKPRPRRKGVRLPTAPEVTQVLPKPLCNVLNIIVKRPKRLRSEKEKEEAEEVLLIEEIEYDSSNQVKFDVYINDDDVKSCTPENSEFLGSFVNVPHRHPTTVKASQRFAISGILEELGADEYEVLLVTLVPRRGYVTIGGIKIEFDTSKSSP